MNPVNVKCMGRKPVPVRSKAVKTFRYQECSIGVLRVPIDTPNIPYLIIIPYNLFTDDIKAY